MTLTEALDLLLAHVGDELCVYANGHLSRAGCAARDRAECFYMLGSMGLASSIGLGLALARPERRVLVLDGDGNVLMNPGALASIAAARPSNLLHVCFDNGAHGSTGGQRTVSDRVRLDELARAAGYPWSERVESAAELAARAPVFLGCEGPAFLLARITCAPFDAPRVPHVPAALTQRFRHALHEPT